MGRSRAEPRRWLGRAHRTFAAITLTLGLAAVGLALAAVPADAGPDAGAASPVTGEDDVVLWYFWGDGCPYCALASDWLDELGRQQPALEVRALEVWHDEANQDRFVAMLRARGAEASGVPTFLLGDEVWVGFSDDVAASIERAVGRAAEDAAGGGPAGAAAAGQTEAPEPAASQLGPFGAVDVGAQPLATATVMIGFVDGFNPCSLWVLTVLLAMILHTGSRLRIAAVGGTFLAVTAGVYGVFIAGVLSAFAITGQLGWVRVVVAVLALAIAAVAIKDYVAGRRGLSLSIPERFKPRIYRGGRALRAPRPLAATLAVTVALAAGVALVELPCTAGFPILWANLVAGSGVGGAGFAALLALYLVVYLSIEITILVAAIVTLRATRLQEVHGRTLKLLGGSVMAAIAVAMLADPAVMERVSGSVAVIGGGVVLAALVALLDRRRSPSGSGASV